jgi:hypothetical protein
MEDYKALLETLGNMAPRQHDGRKGSGSDAALRMTEPDPDLDEQALQWSPELSLMLAILEDAIACYRKTLKRPRQNPDILARQAEFWIRLDDWDSPFSFNNICETLRLEPVATRERILSSRADRRTAA